MNWRTDRYVRTESGWYVCYDHMLHVTYVMDETLVEFIDNLGTFEQVDILAKLYTNAGLAIGRNSHYGM